MSIVIYNLPHQSVEEALLRLVPTDVYVQKAVSTKPAKDVGIYKNELVFRN